MIKKFPKIIGVIGASVPSDAEKKLAYEVGEEIAKRGWIVVNGGLGGVMEEASRGATEKKGVIVGILPGPSTSEANPYVTHPVATNMGHARNAIIAHTADALVAIGKGYGTLSEIALGLKLGKKVLGLKSWNVEGVKTASSASEAIKMIDQGG